MPRNRQPQIGQYYRRRGCVLRHSTLRYISVLRPLPQANAATVVLSALVAGSVLIGNRIFPRIPFSLVAVVGTITASALFHFAEKGIPVIGPVPGGLPSLGLPDVTWSEVLVLVPVALSCFAMIIAQSAATAGAFALRYHEKSTRTPTFSGYQSPMQWRRLVGHSSSMAAPHRPPLRIEGARVARSHS